MMGSWMTAMSLTMAPQEMMVCKITAAAVEVALQVTLQEVRQEALREEAHQVAVVLQKQQKIGTSVCSLKQLAISELV